MRYGVEAQVEQQAAEKEEAEEKDMSVAVKKKYKKMTDEEAAELQNSKPKAKKKKPREPEPKPKKKPREKQAVEEMWEVATETFQRMAEDEITVFSNRVHTVDITTNDHYWTYLGQVSRIGKDSERAQQHFREQAADVIHLLLNNKTLIQKREYKEVPFCPKHK
jgi:hypothetical protein